MEKIALVTGSSRGIGRAVARELARQGWRVCVNYRVRQDCAESLAAELAAEGHAIMTYQADVSQRQQVQAMVRAIQEKWGPVSLLVNNAGVAGQALFQDVTDEMWHRYFSTNVDGAYHAIQAVLPAMLHAHEGCILNISSIWGQRGASCEVTYSCTKAALIGLTRSWHRSWRPPISGSTASRPASSKPTCWTRCRRRYCPSWRRKRLCAVLVRRRISPTRRRFWRRRRRTSSPARC